MPSAFMDTTTSDEETATTDPGSGIATATTVSVKDIDISDCMREGRIVYTELTISKRLDEFVVPGRNIKTVPGMSYDGYKLFPIQFEIKQEGGNNQGVDKRIIEYLLNKNSGLIEKRIISFVKREKPHKREKPDIICGGYSTRTLYNHEGVPACLERNTIQVLEGEIRIGEKPIVTIDDYFTGVEQAIERLYDEKQAYHVPSGRYSEKVKVIEDKLRCIFSHLTGFEDEAIAQRDGANARRAHELARKVNSYADQPVQTDLTRKERLFRFANRLRYQAIEAAKTLYSRVYECLSALKLKNNQGQEK
jgi:hypothetical protein